MRLYCKKCHVELTEECELGSIYDYDENPGDRKPTVPEGNIIIFHEDKYQEYYTAGSNHPQKRLVSTNGAFALNPIDIIQENIRSHGLDNGCCGSDGCDGFNRSCKCDNVIGTEWSDCWTPAEIRLEPLKVELWS